MSDGYEPLIDVDLGVDDCETCGTNFNDFSIYRDEDGYNVEYSIGCYGGYHDHDLTRDRLIEIMTEQNWDYEGCAELLADLKAGKR